MAWIPVDCAKAPPVGQRCSCRRRRNDVLRRSACTAGCHGRGSSIHRSHPPGDVRAAAASCGIVVADPSSAVQDRRQRRRVPKVSGSKSMVTSSGESRTCCPGVRACVEQVAADALAACQVGIAFDPLALAVTSTAPFGDQPPDLVEHRRVVLLHRGIDGGLALREDEPGNSSIKCRHGLERVVCRATVSGHDHCQFSMCAAYAQKRVALGLVPRSAALATSASAVRASVSRNPYATPHRPGPRPSGWPYATFRHISRGCRGSRFARRFQPRFVLVCRPFDLRAASVLAESQPTCAV